MEKFIRRTAWLGIVAALATAPARGDEMPGLEYPHFGVSLIGPTGWVGKFVISKYVVARWQREDPETHDARAVVEIRALPGREMTLRQFADVLGKQIGGEVVDKSITVDGAAAWRLEVDRPGGGLGVRGAIVVEHAGVLYAILGGGVPGEDWRAATRQVLDKWKWIPLEPPAGRLRYLDVRAVLLQGRVIVPMPAGMGVAEADRSWNDAADTVTLGLCNFKRGGDDFVMTVALKDRREGETIEAYRERLIQSLRARTKLPLEWREVPDRETRRATPFAKIAETADGQATYEQVACFEADEHRAVVVTFQIVPAGDEDRAFYERQAAYMLGEMDVVRRQEGL